MFLVKKFTFQFFIPEISVYVLFSSNTKNSFIPSRPPAPQSKGNTFLFHVDVEIKMFRH